MVEISFLTLPSLRSCWPVTAVTVTSRVMSVPELVMNSLLPLMTQLPVFQPGGGLRAAGVRARLRFGQAEACERLSGREQRQPFLLLGIGSEAVDGMAPRETPASSVMATDWSTRPSCSSARARAK